MPVSRKPSHVSSDFSQQDFSRPLAYTGNAIEDLNFFLEREQKFFNPRVQPLNHSFVVLNEVELLGQQEPVMVRDCPNQCLFQLCEFCPHAPFGKFGDCLFIRLPGDNQTQHGPPRSARNVRGYRSQLDIGILQDLLQPVNGLSPVPNDRSPSARQDPPSRRWHRADGH